MKRWGARLANVIKHLTQSIFIVTQSLEEWPTKAIEAPSPHDVRLTWQDTNPVF